MIVIGAPLAIKTAQPPIAGTAAVPDSVPGEKTGERTGESAGERTGERTGEGEVGLARSAGLVTGAGAIAAQEQKNDLTRSQNAFQLDPEEREEVEELKERDREVRAHERAHVNAGQPYAGQPSFEFEVGPDGRRYAVSGEVSIDSGRIQGDPEATIRKMEIVKRAALAPAEPSDQDRRVAAKADAIRRQAERELARQQQAERRQLLEGGNPGDGAGRIQAIPLEGVIA